MSLARMKTKKPNKQPEPRGRRRPPPQAGGWSGPRGLPMTSAVAPGCWQSGHFQGGGAVHARHRHGSLNSAESAGPCSRWKPGLRGAAQRPVGSQPSPARPGSSAVTSPPETKPVTQLDGARGVQGTDGARGFLEVRVRDKQRGESSQAQALAGDQPGVAPCFGAAEPPPEKSLRVPADDRSDRWQSGVRRCRGISSLFDIELTALF